MPAGSSELVFAAAFYSIAVIVVATFAWHAFGRWVDLQAGKQISDNKRDELERAFHEQDARVKKAVVEAAKATSEAIGRIESRMDGLEFKIGAGGITATRTGIR